MTFRNVLIIEKTGNIPVEERFLHCGPMRLGEIEIFEDNFIKNNIPYVLAQVETTVFRETIKGRASMYKKGYCLFTRDYKLEV